MLSANISSNVYWTALDSNILDTKDDIIWLFIGKGWRAQVIISSQAYQMPDTRHSSSIWLLIILSTDIYNTSIPTVRKENQKS